MGCVGPWPGQPRALHSALNLRQELFVLCFCQDDAVYSISKPHLFQKDAMIMMIEAISHHLHSRHVWARCPTVSSCRAAGRQTVELNTCWVEGNAAVVVPFGDIWTAMLIATKYIDWLGNRRQHSILLRSELLLYTSQTRSKLLRDGSTHILNPSPSLCMMYPPSKKLSIRFLLDQFLQQMFLKRFLIMITLYWQWRGLGKDRENGGRKSFRAWRRWIPMLLSQ